MPLNKKTKIILGVPGPPWDERKTFLHKSPLELIVGGFEAIKTWRGRGGFTPTNSGIKWTDRMPVHARFTF